MKRFAAITIAAISVLFFAMGNGPLAFDVVAEEAAEYGFQQEEDETSTALVDMVADLIEKRGKNDSTIYLVGNVIFHHNGAIIQCDSAKKYSQNTMDFFGNVIINKDSAYIYGDKASYDGRSNIAKVYAPIIKMMRGDASLYTYNLTFNTKTNIGYYDGGGMIIHKDTNRMESLEGEYNSDLNEIIFRKNVALRNPSYTAKSDSLTYNLDNEVVTFLTHTTIWTKDGDMLQASEGNILTSINTCQFTKDSYVLSSDREMWADTLSYLSTMKQITMLRNIQIIDTSHKIIAFGDWGFWDDSIGKALLTDNPSVRSYSSDRTDTMYLRADSMFLISLNDSIYYDTVFMRPRTDSLSLDSGSEPDSIDNTGHVDVIGVLASDSSATASADFENKDSASMTVTRVIPRLFKCYHKVRGWSSEYQFICDSIVGYSKDSMGTMYGKPVLWNENNQLIAGQIDVYTENEKLDWADLTINPIIIQKILPVHPVLQDSMRYNQASGNSMQAYFRNNELDSAILNGNVQNLYWMDKNGYTAAFADVQCGDLTIFFRNRTLRRMRWNGNVDWKIYPIEKIPRNVKEYLPDFEWFDTLRPKTPNEISDRVLRPSRRLTARSVVRPGFLIEKELTSAMDNLKKQGTWTDRTEQTSITPAYFLTR